MVFGDIFQLLGYILNLIIDFFKDIITVIKNLVIVSTTFGDFLSWIPHEVWFLVELIIGVVVVYKVVGREG